jgi:hypothetical protein
MASEKHQKWAFAARFRRHAFGWRSQPAITRIKEAVSEIKKVWRRDPILSAQGAVLFFEKLSPALEHIDSSSGAIGTAVNHAIEALVPILSTAPAEGELREQWLERLWNAIEDDGMPYIENLTDYWGDLCAGPAIASKWANQWISMVRLAWNPDPQLRGYFKGTTACLSCLLKAGRNAEVLELLELAPFQCWEYRRWGVKALTAMGRTEDALIYARTSRGLNDSPIAIARACEEILLSEGKFEEAYDGYALEANQQMTYLATFRCIVSKYPHKDPREILRDLAAGTPGNEGKWFAAAKSAGLYREAIALANHSPCDPKTLIRAARDAVETEPKFAVEAGLAAIKWLVEGYGYEITGLDVLQAYQHTISAAERAGCGSEIRDRIRRLVAQEASGDRFVNRVLGRELA